MKEKGLVFRGNLCRWWIRNRTSAEASSVSILIYEFPSSSNSYHRNAETREMMTQSHIQKSSRLNLTPTSFPAESALWTIVISMNFFFVTLRLISNTFEVGDMQRLSNR